MVIFAVAIKSPSVPVWSALVQLDIRHTWIQSRTNPGRAWARLGAQLVMDVAIQQHCAIIIVVSLRIQQSIKRQVYTVLLLV